MTASGRPRRRAPSARVRRHRTGLLIVLAVLAGAIWLERPTASALRAQRTAGTALDPAAFSDGACIALPPLKGDRHVTVFLDAGHGGIDPGAVGTTSAGATVIEAKAALAVELAAATRLENSGFQVVVSRTSDTSVVRLVPADLAGGVLSLTGAHMDVVARDRCANLARARALVGIYFDSAASSSAAGSLTAYDAVRPFAPANQRLAQLLQRDTLAAMNANGWGIPDAGVLPDSGLGSLVPTTETTPFAVGARNYHHLLLLGPPVAGFQDTPSTMPGSVIEPLFLTDPFEASIATSSEGVSAMAEGVASAVEQYFAPASASTQG
ncbi:MAG TPA: N-acetylmuramoyl-L-alanine amidase [Acidimicrobiales bacterium]|nr:N-acetylmuramoyl-L-alanine amidase [Acidimicrobiales bacterium]